MGSRYDVAFAAIDAGIPGPVGDCIGCMRCRIGDHWDCHGCQCQCFRPAEQQHWNGEGNCCKPKVAA